MNWLQLLIASVMEIGWVISLKQTQGFTKIIPMLFYAFFGFTSAYFFSQALKSIPLAVAYSIWMAIAVIGTFLSEIIVQNKPVNWTNLLFIMLIIAGVVGLKLSQGSAS